MHSEIYQVCTGQRVAVTAIKDVLLHSELFQICTEHFVAAIAVKDVLMHSEVRQICTGHPVAAVAVVVCNKDCERGCRCFSIMTCKVNCFEYLETLT